MSKPMIKGDHTFQKDGEFDGMIGGKAIVKSGVSLKMSGMVNGNLVIEKGAKVELTGLVGGKILNDGELV